MTSTPLVPVTPVFPRATRMASASWLARSAMPDWTISGPRPFILTVTVVSDFGPSSIAVNISLLRRIRPVLRVVGHPQLRLVLPVHQPGIGRGHLVEDRHDPPKGPRTPGDIGRRSRSHAVGCSDPAYRIDPVLIGPARDEVGDLLEHRRVH